MKLPFDRKAALHRLIWFFALTTLANVLIGTQVTYRAVEHKGDAPTLRWNLPRNES